MSSWGAAEEKISMLQNILLGVRATNSNVGWTPVCVEMRFVSSHMKQLKASTKLGRLNSHGKMWHRTVGSQNTWAGRAHGIMDRAGPPPNMSVSFSKQTQFPWPWANICTLIASCDSWVQTLHCTPWHLCRIFPWLLQNSSPWGAGSAQHTVPAPVGSLTLAQGRHSYQGSCCAASQSHLHAEVSCRWSCVSLGATIGLLRGAARASLYCCSWQVGAGTRASWQLCNKTSRITRFSVPISRRKIFGIILVARCVKQCLSSQPQAAVTRSSVVVAVSLLSNSSEYFLSAPPVMTDVFIIHSADAPFFIAAAQVPWSLERSKLWTLNIRMFFVICVLCLCFCCVFA